jgi:hypothetical protein
LLKRGCRFAAASGFVRPTRGAKLYLEFGGPETRAYSKIGGGLEHKSAFLNAALWIRAAQVSFPYKRFSQLK